MTENDLCWQKDHSKGVGNTKYRCHRFDYAIRDAGIPYRGSKWDVAFEPIQPKARHSTLTVPAAHGKIFEVENSRLNDQGAYPISCL